MKISQAVILAAGESSRFWPYNNKHKSLFKLAGKPLIYHTLEGLKKAGIKEVVIVQSLKKDIEIELKEYPLKGLKINYVVQEKPISTGDALFGAKNFINGPFFMVHGVMLGDRKTALDNYLPLLLEKFKGGVVLFGSKTSFPWEFGIAEIKDDKVIRIIENPKKGKEPSDIKTNGIYIFPKEIFNHIKKAGNGKEDCLIDAINSLIKNDGAEMVVAKEDPVSLKYPWNAFSAIEGIIEKNSLNKTFPGVKIGKNVIIRNKVFIGKDTTIGDNTVINGPCYIGERCKIGNNNFIRGPVNLENDVVTGAFFEIKNSIVQKGTHFHSGYVGDSIIGSNCRFGAGFITANRRIDRGNIKTIVKENKTDTGLTYLGTIVGNNTSFGIHAGTMPGVIIGNNCLVGPGTLVFKNIKDDTTFYTDFKGVVENEKS